MIESIPSDDGEPLRSGDRVRILPTYQDPGDDAFERIVVETPSDCSRVLMRTIIPGFLVCPTGWIEASWLERLS